MIPTEPKNRKLSKIETLRLASSYISHLATQLIIEADGLACHQSQAKASVAAPLSAGKSTGRRTHPVCTFCIRNSKLLTGRPTRRRNIATTSEAHSEDATRINQAYLGQASATSRDIFVAMSGPMEDYEMDPGILPEAGYYIDDSPDNDSLMTIGINYCN